MKEKEIWKDIEGWGGDYQVSNFGEIRSFKNGEIKLKSKRIINQEYYVTTLHLRGLRKYVKVHRMLAIAFIPNPDNKPQVNHKDGNKLNNHIDNLEWVTAKENTNHGINMGLIKRMGEDNWRSTITERDVQIIRYMVKVLGFSYQITADFMESSKSMIAHIVKNRSWQHLKEDFSELRIA